MMKKMRILAAVAAAAVLVDSMAPEVVLASSVTDLQQQAENIINGDLSRAIGGKSEEEDSVSDNETGADTGDVSVASYKTVEISNRKDFDDMVRNCHRDTWSTDKKIVLNTDLDFEGKEFEPIESFGGIFDGNGHTLSGVGLEGDVAETGVFGTIRRSGTVQNLTIKGRISPENIQSGLGGIAGINYGTIQNCKFQGTIRAERRLGGIVGYNGRYGSVTGCEASGSMTGRAACGGIAGSNAGTISACKNEMKVNTEYQDSTLTLDQLNSALDDGLQSGNLLNSENLEWNGDTGGIAGFSSGVITSCTNSAVIGYEHVGYHIGGIAGRSSGFLQNNVNSGTIYGRKDTGGIVGQMQPYLAVEFAEDTLKDLENQMNTLQDLVNTELNEANNDSAQITQHLKSIGSLSGTAKDAAKNLADESAKELNETADQVNQATGTIQSALSSFSDISSELEKFLGDVTDAGTRLTNSFSSYVDGLGISDEDREKLNGSWSDFQSSTGQMKEDLKNLSDALNNREDLLDERLTGIEKAFQQVRDRYGQIKSDIDTVLAVIQENPIQDSSLGDTKEVTDSLTGLENALNRYPDISGKLSGALDSLASLNLQVNGTSESMQTSGDQLYQSLGQIEKELDAMNSDLSGGVAKGTSNLQAISAQVNTVFQSLTDEINKLKNPGDNRSLEDVSNENIENVHQGRTTKCINNGDVQADTNVGGITGMMGVEYDLNPDEDIRTTGDTSLDYIFQVRCILDRCTNNGTVGARGSYSGGIAGQMEMGLVAQSENYGNLESEGDYTGGVAGYTTGLVRNSSAKCDLSGEKYIGGIAGYAVNLHDNYAMVHAGDAKQYVGAIAGKVKSTDAAKVYHNYYYAEGLYGIDGVSYTGIAEGVDYDTLSRQFSEQNEGSSRFTELTLTFRADDKVVKTLKVGYGDSVTADQLPEVPEKKGFYGEWSRNDFQRIVSDETITAEYSRINTLLSSKQTRKSGLAILEAAGKFNQKAQLDLKKVQPQKGEVERWIVTIPNDKENSHEMRYFPSDESSKVEIYVIEDGKKEKVKTEKNGKYTIFHIENTDRSGTAGSMDAAFAVEEINETGRMIVIAVCMAAAAAVVALLLIRRHHRKKKKQEGHGTA